jgi:hypothetical protein
VGNVARHIDTEMPRGFNGTQQLPLSDYLAHIKHFNHIAINKGYS